MMKSRIFTRRWAGRRTRTIWKHSEKAMRILKNPRGDRGGSTPRHHPRRRGRIDHCVDPRSLSLSARTGKGRRYGTRESHDGLLSGCATNDAGDGQHAEYNRVLSIRRFAHVFGNRLLRVCEMNRGWPIAQCGVNLLHLRGRGETEG